jgi:hypothetical protein
MKRYLLASVLVVLSLLIGFHTLNIWRGFVFSVSGTSREDLLTAIRLTPDNPDPFYRLGILYQWSLLQGDLEKADRYLRGAIERNPLDQGYWIALAQVIQRTRGGAALEQALETAIRLYPASYDGRWAVGNLLLRQGSSGKAFPHFSFLLAHYPGRSGEVYDLLVGMTHDTELILNRIVPETPSSLNLYLAYLYGIGDMATAKRAWGKKASLGYPTDRSETLRHVDFLISRGEILEAHNVWKARLRKENLPVPAGEDLITNGGFEREGMLGGGFDWKIGKVSGAAVSRDSSRPHEGKTSLRISFDGKENVDFYHVSQVVPLKPDTDYVLRASMRTEDITTRSGVKVEVVGIGASLHESSESLTGDNGWKEIKVVFRTPHAIQGGMVRVRRERIDKFDRFLAGTVWLDNVRLTEGR